MVVGCVAIQQLYCDKGGSEVEIVLQYGELYCNEAARLLKKKIVLQ